MPMGTHICLHEYSMSFLPIMVSFLIYLVIFTPDKIPLILQLSLTYLFHIYGQS